MLYLDLAFVEIATLLPFPACLGGEQLHAAAATLADTPPIPFAGLRYGL